MTSSKRRLLTLSFGGALLVVRVIGQTTHPPAPPTTLPDSAQEAAELPDDPDDTSPPKNAVLTPPGDLKPPVLIYSVQPKYTKSARKQKLNGTVQVALTVDEAGLPQDVQVARAQGTELDDIALQAVRQYRFKPAMRAGKPVPVKLYVEVKFQIW